MPAVFDSRTAPVMASLLVIVGVSASTVLAADAETGFKSIFDGRSLSGWSAGDGTYWSVEDGAITGRITKEHPCATNQYLVWMGGELADFELKLEFRLIGEGGVNGGFQFRSRLLPDHDVCGYQVDNNLRTDWLVLILTTAGPCFSTSSVKSGSCARPRRGATRTIASNRRVNMERPRLLRRGCYSKRRGSARGWRGSHRPVSPRYSSEFAIRITVSAGTSPRAVTM